MSNKVKFWAVFILPFLGVLLLGLEASGGRQKDHPYRHSTVDMPISLSVGSIRTAKFSAPEHWYWILVQVEKPLPFIRMECMMGVIPEPIRAASCSSDDPLLQAHWRLWEGNQIVDKGTMPKETAAKFTDKHIFKFLGNFHAETGKKYVLEVTFTKDGTPLNVANPHLIIVREGQE